jgi:hypothetical protein
MKSSWRTDRVVTTCRLPLNTVGLTANKGNLEHKHHVYAVDYYSSVAQGYSISTRGPLLQYPLQERTINPQTNNNIRVTLPRIHQ